MTSLTRKGQVIFVSAVFAFDTGEDKNQEHHEAQTKQSDGDRRNPVDGAVEFIHGMGI
jgi:hypothetical protein